MHNVMIRDYFQLASNKVEFPGISYTGGTYQLVAKDYFFSGLAPCSDSWFDDVSYQGAFGTYNWASGWTLISQEGILTD